MELSAQDFRPRSLSFRYGSIRDALQVLDAKIGHIRLVLRCTWAVHDSRFSNFSRPLPEEGGSYSYNLEIMMTFSVHYWHGYEFSFWLYNAPLNLCQLASTQQCWSTFTFVEWTTLISPLETIFTADGFSCFVLCFLPPMLLFGFQLYELLQIRLAVLF